MESATTGYRMNHFQGRGLEVSKVSKPTDLDERVIEIRCQIDSVRSRIADLEWTYDRCTDDEAEQNELYDDRRKAVDKLRYLQEELATIEVRRHRLGKIS